jgi:AcrR family transcriptional regulator
MREDMLAAARNVVVREGINGFTIRQFLDEAGVAPGTFYAYFPGKAALVEALIDRTLREHAAAWTDRGGDPQYLFAEQVREALSAPLDGATVMAELRARAGEEDPPRQVRDFNARLIDLMRPVLDRADLSRDAAGVDRDALLELLDILSDGMHRRAGKDTFVTSYQRVGAVALTLLEAASLIDKDGEGTHATDRATPRDKPQSRRRRVVKAS